MHPSGCFEAGRSTLTQSSWTALGCRSRKWMSGHAGSALAIFKDCRQLGNLTIMTLRGVQLRRAKGDLRLPLDFEKFFECLASTGVNTHWTTWKDSEFEPIGTTARFDITHSCRRSDLQVHNFPAN